jgi:predicted transcriptional regulator of viral defense system
LKFFATHPTFTRAEFARAFEHDPQSRTVNSLLSHHVRAGRIKSIGRGVFATISAGVLVDFYMVAAKLRADGIFAYRSALELHGFSIHSGVDVILLSAKRRMRRRTPLGMYQFVLPPKTLSTAGQTAVEAITMFRSCAELRVTSIERTVVDALNHPKLSGGVDEVFRSLDRVKTLDGEKVVAYTMLLQKPTLAALVGWWLDRHRLKYCISNDVLRPLRYALPINPAYVLGAKPGDSVLMKPWQLLVPKRIGQLEWARS